MSHLSARSTLDTKVSLHNAFVLYTDEQDQRRSWWHRTFSNHANNSRLNQGALTAVTKKLLRQAPRFPPCLGRARALVCPI